MSVSTLAASDLTLAGGDYAIVGVVAVVALAALAIGFVLLREVLAAGEGTSKMQDIGRAVQEGAAAYLNRQFRTLGNIRVAAASTEGGGREKAMRIAFRTGGVVGMFTVGLGLFGAAVVVLVYTGQAPKVLEGFGFGAALLAMFMRVGGGIFTKAA